MFIAYEIKTNKVGFVVFVPLPLRPTAVELSAAQRKEPGHKFRFIPASKIDWIASAYPRVKSLADKEENPSSYFENMTTKWDQMIMESSATGRNTVPKYFAQGTKHLNLTYYYVTPDEMFCRQHNDFDKALELQAKAFEVLDKEAAAGKLRGRGSSTIGK